MAKPVPNPTPALPTYGAVVSSDGQVLFGPTVGTIMTDDALITFGAPVAPGAVGFTDVGYMPITAVTLGGTALALPGKAAGFFLEYSATGVQHFSPTGVPTTADYTSLHFNLVGYTGPATFGHAANGTPTLSGANHQTVLAQGDLISGGVAFQPSGGIAGEVVTSLQVGGQTVGQLDVSIVHAAGDIGPAANGFTLSGGTLQATFVPAHIG